MDVNRAQGVATVSDNPQGKSGRENEDKNGSDHRGDDDTYRSHGTDSAVEIGGLAAEITPAVQKLLDSLAAEIEPLRAQLKLSRDREASLREDLAKHAFLPVPGRREFYRELNHVLNHLNDLDILPSLVILHVANASDVREAHGRDTLDRYLVHIATTIDRVLQPTEVLGNLGGDDFAIILLADSEEDARRRAGQIAGRLSESPMPGDSSVPPPDVMVGGCELERGATAEASVAAADNDLRKRNS